MGLTTEQLEAAEQAAHALGALLAPSLTALIAGQLAAASRNYTDGDANQRQDAVEEAAALAIRIVKLTHRL